MPPSWAFSHSLEIPSTESIRRLLSLWNRSGALVSRTKYNSLSTFTWDAMANSILHPLLSHFRISPWASLSNANTAFREPGGGGGDGDETRLSLTRTFSLDFATVFFHPVPLLILLPRCLVLLEYVCMYVCVWYDIYIARARCVCIALNRNLRWWCYFLLLLLFYTWLIMWCVCSGGWCTSSMPYC